MAAAGGPPASPLQQGRALARRAYRKAIHRKVEMGWWSVRAGDSSPPSVPNHLPIELLGPDRFDEVLPTNPHLSAEDLARFHQQPSTCIVVRQGDEIVASSWMTGGDVYVTELQRSLPVPASAHFSCRSYVSDGHRGAALFGHMIHTYAAQVDDPSDEICGLVYAWNVASVRSLETIGWRRTGTASTRFLLGRKFPRSKRHPPAPALPKVPRPAPGGPAATLPPCLLVAEEVWGGTLHAARSLGKTGVPVLVATAGAGASVYGRSRWVADTTDLDPTDPAGFCDALVRWVEETAPGEATIPVIPLSDHLAAVLDAERHRFPPRFRLALPPGEVTRPLLDKVSSIRLAEEAGLDVPPWAEVRSPDDMEAAARLALPVIVRPTSWSTTGDRYFKLIVCHTDEARTEVLREALAGGAELVVQEYLDEPEDAVELALVWRSHDGTSTAVVTGRKRRRSSPDGGVMAWGETVELPDVAAQAEAFLDHTGFTGLGGLEVIRSGGKPRFVEFNPRLESIHFLGAVAGVDTVVLAYQDLALDQRPTGPVHPEPAAVWVGSAWLHRLRNDRASWRLVLAERRMFGRIPHRARSVWDPTDPAPSVVLALRLARRAVRSSRRHG